MFKKRCVKIGIVLLVLGALVVINTNTFGAINQTYYDKIVEDLNVVEGALDSKVRSSVLLDAISILVYAVGSLVEWILGLMFEGISGSKIFPWADAILFNAVPLLDINVFNPAGTSLVGIMQEFVASSYWTVFSIALAFLGIAIMVTAIKLVVSTIASDKALYKQAIMKWLMGFIMLWGIHFFISFVLYLNEGLVETASNISTQAVQEASVDLAQIRDTTQTDQVIVYNFAKAMMNNQWNGLTWLGVILGAVGVAVVAAFTWPAWVAVAGGASLATITTAVCSTAVAGTFLASSTTAFIGGVELTRTEFITIQGSVIAGARDASMNKYKSMNIEEVLKELAHDDTVMVASTLLQNEDYVNSLQAICKRELLGDSEAMAWKAQNDPMALLYLAGDVNLIINNKYDIAIKESDQIKDKGGEEKSYKELLENYLISIREIPSAGRVSRIVNTSTWETELRGNLTNDNPQEKDVNYDQMLDWYCKAMIYAREDYEDRISGGDGVQDESNLVSTLAKAFKKMAWTNTASSWKPSKPVIQGALMYAILVAQSLIFFISYAKRLFYVIVLILVAPIIVVYDFFTKFPG